jgi:hypothetical protein
MKRRKKNRGFISDETGYVLPNDDDEIGDGDESGKEMREARGGEDPATGRRNLGARDRPIKGTLKKKGGGQGQNMYRATEKKKKLMKSEKLKFYGAALPWFPLVVN